MPKITWKVDRVIDSHVHFLNVEPVPHFYQIMESVNYGAANLMAVPGPKGADQNRWIVERKSERPDFFFVFGCMAHDPDKVAASDGRYLVGQIDRLMAENFDGLKMLEGKPAVRRSWMPLALDHKYFYPYWDRVAEIDAPVTLHVSDPIDMWAPDSSAEYHKLDSQDEFLRQAEAILQRHPKLRINFPHFMYLSPQLDRLAELFARYPGIMTDLAMGSEFLYYLSDDIDRARDFFIRWQDRILYGTDINDRNSLKHAHAKAEILRLFLETDESFVNIVDVAMSRPPSKGSNGRVELHGLHLPKPVLEKVLGRNFEKFVGRVPKALNTKSLV